MEFRVENTVAAVPSLEIRLLGRLTVLRGGTELKLPPSRKVVALLAYLLLADRPVPRETLCDLLWDIPDDPRGELRWTLSRLRAVLDTPECRRVIADGEFIALDRRDIAIDALAVAEAGHPEDQPALRAALVHCHGGFLEGWQPPRSAPFAAWLEATREEYRQRHAALLESLARLLPDADPERTCLLRLRAELLPEAPPLPAEPRPPEEPAQASDQAPSRRPSIAVLPFAAAEPSAAILADGLAHDVIAGLARLRGLFVIARGTTFTCRDIAHDPREIGRRLGVAYACTGQVIRSPTGIAVTVELAATADGRVLWSDSFADSEPGISELRERVAAWIITTLDVELGIAERNRALHKPFSALDAWEAYHRGLWHMHRYTRADNDFAASLFARATRLDPGFARAYSGLSFTHFQNAFLLRTADRQREIDLAYDTAGRALMADLRDPSAHWAMGRALWLRRAPGEALSALGKAVQLSPNFAVGHYGRAFVEAQSGDPNAAVEAAEASIALSPYDPLLFGFHASRTIALLRLGDAEAAAESARLIAAQPNANAHARAIGALAIANAGHRAEAAAALETVRQSIPGYGLDDFLSAFRLSEETAAIFRRIAPRLGLA